VAQAPAKPYGTAVEYADPGYLDGDGNQASKSGKKGVERYPLSADKVMAAWSYINQQKNASQYTAEQLKTIKGKISAAMKEHGHDVAEGSTGRALTMAPPEIVRWHALEDIHIVSRADGDGSGRLVEAFAAVFDEPAEIMDFEGHYLETIDRSAFNKRIADLQRAKSGFAGVKVLYNHGMTIHGTPSERFSMPVGTPAHIEATSRGLLTRTEYNRTPLAEEVLELIRSGSISSQSFTGRIVRSDPQLGRGRQRQPKGGHLPTVRRTELGLKEYGGVVWPSYDGAEIFGVRMATPGTWEPASEFDEGTSPDGEAAAGEPLETDEHSARYHQHALYALRSRELREAKGLVW
jgi:phage head maturation protease